MDMTEVKAFNAELSALYENKPPISKAKMNAITKGAIKAIKFYKHVVHSVEKFILKCKPEYKIPGLYVIDSIVRQSRHQFGPDKDVFAPRFSKNMQQTFMNLFRCPPEDKRNVIRVLNLWQKNNVFGPDVIQPLFDMADPNHPIHQELQQQSLSQYAANDSISNNNISLDAKNSPAVMVQHTPNLTPQEQTGKTSDATVLARLRQIQHALHDRTSTGTVNSSTLPVVAPLTQDAIKQHDQHYGTQAGAGGAVKFNRKLLNLDFEYESDDDGGGIAAADSDSPPQSMSQSNSMQHMPLAMPPQMSNQQMSGYMQPNPNDALGSILTNPEVLRQLQSLQAQIQMVASMPIQNISLPPDMHVNEMQQFQNLHQQMQSLQTLNQVKSPIANDTNNESDIEFVDDAGPQVIEIDGNDSRSSSPRSGRRRRSSSKRRSRNRSRNRSSRSRSRSRRRNDRRRDREKEKTKVKDKEHESERQRKGLPPIKKNNMSVCSTTLWVGHLSKLASSEELSDEFGSIGIVAAVDVVAPRGCAFVVMERRRDAAKAINKLDKCKIHGRPITLAWAPGKGVKGREWKDFWEGEVGASYLPWSRLKEQNDIGELNLSELEDGGMIDEETIPAWLQQKASEIGIGGKKSFPPASTPVSNSSNMQVNLANIPPPSMNPLNTSLPPPVSLPNTLGVIPPVIQTGGLPMPMPFPFMGQGPFAHLSGLMGPMGMPMMPGNPMLPPPIAAALAAQSIQMPNMHQPPPNIPLPSNDPIRQDDNMDIDNADDDSSSNLMKTDSTHHMVEEKLNVKPLSEQLQELLSKPPPSFSIPPPPIIQDITQSQSRDENNERESSKEQDRESSRKEREREREGRRERDRDSRRERDGRRDRDRHDRDRDHAERDRSDRDRDRDRDKDKERDRDREGRRNRWGARDRSRDRSPAGNRPDRSNSSTADQPSNRGKSARVEKSLHDRLYEMANGGAPMPQMSTQRESSGRRSSRDAAPPVEKEMDPSPKKFNADDQLSDDQPNKMDLSPNQSEMNRMLPLGPMVPLPPMPMMGPGMGPPPMLGRPLLPPVDRFNFRYRDDVIRMRGPRGPPMRPGIWMDGPPGPGIPPFGPRFNGGPIAFNRPMLYDSPTFDRGIFERPEGFFEINASGPFGGTRQRPPSFENDDMHLSRNDGNTAAMEWNRDGNRDRRNWERNDRDGNDSDRNDRDGNERDRNDRERIDRDRNDRDRSDRERNDRDRSDRERNDRDRSDRERNDKDRTDRDRNDRDRNDRNRNERDRNNRDRNDRDRNNRNRDRSERSSRWAACEETPHENNNQRVEDLRDDQELKLNSKELNAETSNKQEKPLLQGDLRPSLELLSIENAVIDKPKPIFDSNITFSENEPVKLDDVSKDQVKRLDTVNEQTYDHEKASELDIIENKINADLNDDNAVDSYREPAENEQDKYSPGDVNIETDIRVDNIDLNNVGNRSKLENDHHKAAADNYQCESKNENLERSNFGLDKHPIEDEGHQEFSNNDAESIDIFSDQRKNKEEGESLNIALSEVNDDIQQNKEKQDGDVGSTTPLRDELAEGGASDSLTA